MSLLKQELPSPLISALQKLSLSQKVERAFAAPRSDTIYLPPRLCQDLYGYGNNPKVQSAK
jgi:hypothetical protein